MKIDFVIDEEPASISVNSNKPLSLILEEDFSVYSMVSRCKGVKCGLCIVLLDNTPVLSCTVPSFKLRGKKVLTFDYFSKTEDYIDIKKAYESTLFVPCRECYPARTMIIESILRNNENNRDEIIRKMNTVRCTCLRNDDALRIVQYARNNRKERKNAKNKEY